MPVIDADGCKINVQIDGPQDAPALVLSNSLGTNLSMWDDQAKALSGEFRVIRYDQRGHGKSGAPKGPYTIDRLGQDVIAILDNLKIAKAHFVGLSMGGSTGMWLARMAPGRFTKIILSNTGARISTQDVWNARIASVLSKGMTAVIDTTLERWFSNDSHKRNLPAISAVRKMLMTTPAHGYAGCSAAIRDADQRWGIGAVKLPTLVIIGTLDPGTPPAGGEEIASRIRGAKVARLEAAHLSNLEKSEAFTAEVQKFLA
jgi:3-oxoadipate enol-lactonase